MFKFWDGAKWRRVDPLKTLRAIQQHQTYRADVHPALADAGDPEALELMLQACRDVFSVADFDDATGRGLTQGEQLDLMMGFAGFLEGVKKNTKPSPISSVTMPASTSPDLMPKPDSASLSTPTESDAVAVS